jgi:hypothetical protein
MGTEEHLLVPTILLYTCLHCELKTPPLQCILVAEIESTFTRELIHIVFG